MLKYITNKEFCQAFSLAEFVYCDKMALIKLLNIIYVGTNY